MNKMTRISCMIAIAAISSLSAISQTVRFEYDNCGNRISQKITVYKTADSTHLKSGSFTFSDTKTETNETRIVVSPNPTNSSITIKFEDFNESENTTAILYSTSGKMILKKSLESSEDKISLSDLDNGVYILSVVSATRKEQFRLIKHN